MGWSKTAEDNYEALCDNLAVKGDEYNYMAWCYAPSSKMKSASKIQYK